MAKGQNLVKITKCVFSPKNRHFALEESSQIKRLPVLSKFKKSIRTVFTTLPWKIQNDIILDIYGTKVSKWDICKLGAEKRSFRFF